MRLLARGGFRRRLVLVFVGVAGLSAGALALGTFTLFRDYRVERFEARAVENARLGHLIVQRESDPADLEALVGASVKSAGFNTVVTDGDRTVLTSNPGLGAGDIPPGLRERLDAGGNDVAQPIEIDGIRYLAFGGPTRDAGHYVYFLFTQQPLLAEMAGLARVLAVLWLMVVVIAALVGNLVAGRTLLPVREAARAARGLAEGLLETRLPVRTEDEFGVWAACFNEMAEALETKIGELREAHDLERRFTADVAHELRTPLSSLLGAASLLEAEMENLPASARRPAELVISGVRRLRTLVLEVLELYSLDQGATQLSIERFRMDRSVADTVDLCGWSGMVRQNLRAAWLETDRRRFERITTNLIANAVEHGGEGVEITVLEVGPEAVLEVRDSGPGIHPEHMHRILGRFYKADPARQKGGPGLGLAIAAENIRLIGGSLEVDHVQPRGLRFTVRLPRSAPAPACPPEPAAHRPTRGTDTEL